ncbi:MAG TPA: TetR/AcrR family transcriptional regulator [Myxococcaceae bacterium]|nr:TetR/AcrR family transcriptional regulator [Myxococcaceae bacterium]
MANEVNEAPAGREGERKRTILRAAVEVFATKGYHGCRIADVAKEAKVAYGLVYHYFKNKDELLQSVFEHTFEGFVGKLRELAASPSSLEEKVQAIADYSFDSYREDPRAVRVLILQIARSPAIGGATRKNAFAEIIRLCVEMFRNAQAKGELRPDLDPVMGAALLFGTVEMGLTAFVVGLYDAQDPEALARAKEQVAQLFLRGALPREGAAEAEWKRDRSGTKLKAAKRS